MVDSEIPEPAYEETWLTVVKDIALGAAAGLALATFWLLVAVLVGNESGGLGWSIKGCCLFIALFVLVAAGAIVGFLVGDAVGAVCGGAVCYFLPFAVYGAWIQRTIGWKAWFRGGKQGSTAANKTKI